MPCYVLQLLRHVGGTTQWGFVYFLKCDTLYYKCGCILAFDLIKMYCTRKKKKKSVVRAALVCQSVTFVIWNRRSFYQRQIAMQIGKSVLILKVCMNTFINLQLMNICVLLLLFSILFKPRHPLEHYLFIKEFINVTIH